MARLRHLHGRRPTGNVTSRSAVADADPTRDYARAMDGHGGHPLDDVDDHGRWRVGIARGLLVCGRILPIAAVAAVTFSRLSRASWAEASIDEGGFTTAWQPNLAAAISFVLGLALPFIVLPVGSSALTTRDGDRLTVLTVLGTRTIHLPSARVWRAWLPGKGGGSQVALVRSQTGSAILMASEAWVPRSHALLADAVAEPGVRPEWVLHTRGWILMLSSVAVVFACLAVGGTTAGLF